LPFKVISLKKRREQPNRIRIAVLARNIAVAPHFTDPEWVEDCVNQAFRTQPGIEPVYSLGRENRALKQIKKMKQRDLAVGAWSCQFLEHVTTAVAVV
jgi:hypothetical protein